MGDHNFILILNYSMYQKATTDCLYPVKFELDFTPQYM